MTLLKWALLCACGAAGVWLLGLMQAMPALNGSIGLSLLPTCTIVLGSLGAFVFRNY